MFKIDVFFPRFIWVFAFDDFWHIFQDVDLRNPPSTYLYVLHERLVICRQLWCCQCSAITLYQWCIILCLILVSLVVLAFFLEGYLERKLSFSSSDRSHSRKCFHINGHLLYALSSMHMRSRSFLSCSAFEADTNFDCCVVFSKIRNDPLHSTQSVQTSNIFFLNLLFLNASSLIHMLNCSRIAGKFHGKIFFLGRKELIRIMG